MQQPLIQLDGIARDFSDGRIVRRVLKKMDLSIYPGELTILAGPSGSGKTTLLSIMGLILKPSEGKIFMGDEEVSVASESARASMRMKHYGFVFQLAELIPALSVLDNVLIAHSIEKALQQLPVTARGARSVAYMFRTLSLQAFGQRDIAIRQLEQIIADPSPQSPAKSQAYIALALLHFSAGDLSRMKRLTSQMLSFATKNKEVNALPGAHYTSSFLFYKGNDIRSAKGHFQAGFDLRYRSNFMGSISGYLGLIRVNQLQNRLDESQELIALFRSDIVEIMNMDLLPLVEAAQAVQDMLQGDLAEALRWARSPLDDGLDDKTFVFELPILTQVNNHAVMGSFPPIPITDRLAGGVGGWV